MSSNVRSSSVGAQPRPKKLFTSRAESVAAAALDVRCACQFFQTTSLLPERVNPVGSRPTSSLGYSSRPQSRCLEHDQHIFEPDLQRSNLPANELDQLQDDLGSAFSFGEVVGDTDYYAESVISSRPNSPTLRQQPNDHQNYPSDEENASPLNFPGSQMSLDTLINPRPLQQKDPSKSVLLQRRTSQMSSEHLPSCAAQIDPTKSVLLQRRASQRSMESVAIKQRDPSTSSLLRKRMSQSRTLAPEPGQFTVNPYSFKPIAPEPIIPMIQPIVQKLAAPPPPTITNYTRGPYPGEAYPDHYDEPVVVERPPPVEDEKSFGIGIIELLSLGTSLVQRREQRYVERSNEDIRGRSRRSRKEKAEKEKADKEERDRRKAEAKAEREQKRKDDRQTPEPDGQPLVLSQASQQIIEQHRTEPPEEPEAQQPAPTSPMVYIGQNIYIQDQPNIAPPANMDALPAEQVQQTKESPVKDAAPTSVVDNTKISVTANSLISSLMMSSRQPKPVESVLRTPEEPPPVVNYHETISAPVIERTVQPEPASVPFMRQRDPSQSSLLRSRYSCDRDVPMPATPIIRQRDPSTSSLLRSRYSVDKDQTSSPITVQPSTPFMRQRDPSQSSLLRKRLSESPAPPPASILAVAIATTGPFGSQQSLQHGDNFIRQKDPTTSSLIQKRMHERSHSQDNYSPAEKITKTVSFEYDKKLMTGAYDASGMASKAEVMQRMTKMSTEMRDRMDWIERTYNMR